MSPASPPPWPATCAPSSTAATPSAASSPWTSSPRPTTSSASRSWSDQRGAMSDELEKPLGVMGKQEQRPPVPDSSSLIAPRSSLTLASASPRRRELLAVLGLPFDVTAADVDETIAPSEDPGQAAVRLARAKAEAVAWREWDALVLGADTVVILDGRSLGKPADPDEAMSMLRALRGRRHTVVTGVAFCDSRTGETRTAAPETAVSMRAYSHDEIAASIAAGTPFDKAGAYAIQDESFAPAERIDGCYCNVVGLPLWTVYQLLREIDGSLPVRRPSET